MVTEIVYGQYDVDLQNGYIRNAQVTGDINHVALKGLRSDPRVRVEMVEIRPYQQPAYMAERLLIEQEGLPFEGLEIVQWADHWKGYHYIDGKKIGVIQVKTNVTLLGRIDQGKLVIQPSE